jgi:ubiquitin-activating enzyme E1
LQQYPRDYIKEDGTSFWSGNKRPPKIIPFNKNDKFCLLYVNTFVQIFCKIIKMEFNKNDILKVLDSLDFSISFKNNVNFNNELINELKSIDNYNLLNPEIFDKDNDENGHINFMHSISVIRANNYDIEILDIFHTKSISGKIVPALSTTTSSIVGLACIQLYLLVENNINSLKCSNINLGVNFYDSSYPEELNYFKDVENPGPNKLPLKLLSTPFSVWDYIEIKKSLKAKEFISIFENKYGIYIDFITCNQTKIIEPLLIDKNDSDYNMKIEDLYSKNNGIKLDSNRKILELKISASKEDCSILIPSIKYIFK